MNPRACTALALAALAACGGGSGGGPDAAPGDAPPFSDGPPTSCTYDEAHDVENGQAAEASGVRFERAAISLCGILDPARASGVDVDIDRFALTVDADADVMVDVAAPDGDLLDELTIELRSAAGDGGRGRLFVHHGVFLAHLAAGEYELTVAARGAPPDQPVAYRVGIASDDPAAHCPPVDVPVDYVEADESGRQHHGNDVVEVHDDGRRALTTAADDPEDTGLVMSAGTVKQLAGASGATSSAGDDYRDRDTFLLSTGAETDELTIRLRWDHSVGADLDLMLFPAGEVDDFAAATARSTNGDDDEVMVTAVAPSSSYWLWVGAHDGAAPYKIAICAGGQQVTD